MVQCERVLQSRSAAMGETLDSIRQARRSEAASDAADAACAVTLGGVPEEAPVLGGVPEEAPLDAPLAQGRAVSGGLATADAQGQLPGGGSPAGSGQAPPMEKAMSQTASGFLMQRQISQRFPTVITPSEQSRSRPHSAQETCPRWLLRRQDVTQTRVVLQLQPACAEVLA